MSEDFQDRRELSIERIPRTAGNSISRALTTSPPAEISRGRGVSIDVIEEVTKKNYHKRNIQHIEKLKQKNSQKYRHLEDEKRKLEFTRERLARLVLKRAERLRKQAEENKVPVSDSSDEDEDQENQVEDIKEECNIEPDVEQRKQLRRYYKARYTELLKSMQENNKSKAQKKLKELAKQEKARKRLQEEMGLTNVTSKLYGPNLTGIINETEAAEMRLNKINALASTLSKKPKGEPELKEEEKHKAKDAAEKILKRAQDNLTRIAERKMVEQQKEQDQKEKEKKIRQFAREAVLKNSKLTTQLIINDSSDSENEEGEDQPAKKSRKPDEKVLKRLTQSHKKSQGPVLTDWTQFRKRYKLDTDVKVFIINGAYPDIKKALKRRDWFENPEKTSPCFDFIWTLKKKDIDFKTLQDQQICNHFEKNSSICTKAGLSNNLKNLIWFNNIDIDTFFPRSFDVSEESELLDFITEFKVNKAQSILKKFHSGEQVSKELVKVAAKVCERKLMDLDDLIDNPNASNWMLVTEDEWQILSKDDLSVEDLRNKKHNEYLNKIDSVSSVKPNKPKQKKKSKSDTKQAPSSEADSTLQAKVSELISQLKDKFPQFDMNGQSNSWIVKPAGLSRGRGIACYNTLVEIMDNFKKEGMWVVQKYIENPMVVLRKKFDIRQWVMVTDWNPLTVWFYERSYLRFGVEDFQITDLSNKFIHLTNNSIVKQSENFYTTEIEGSMWHSEEFAEFLMEQHGSDLWEEQIKPKIKSIVTYSLECVQDMMDIHKNSFELFGYDIMLDENLNPWLIEINSSPAMDYSTQVTKELVKEVLEDCVKVLIDYNLSSKKKRKGVDTGNFSLIYKAKRIVDRPIQSFGLNLMCEVPLLSTDRHKYENIEKMIEALGF